MSSSTRRRNRWWTFAILILRFLATITTARGVSRGNTAAFAPPPSLYLAASSRTTTPSLITMASSSDKKDNFDDDSSSLQSAAKSAIDFLTLARGLKTTPRTGWIRQEANPKIESVADHSWRIALMALVSSTSSGTNSGMDTTKCLKMALVHDLAEAQVGDITPHCGISDTDKHAREEAAMTRMTATLMGGSHTNLVGSDILALWKEYEEGTSPEANLVKDMDKLEMILQALEYEQDGLHKKSLDGFFDSTRDKWRTEIGKAWGREIESRRQIHKRDKVEESSLEEPDAKKPKAT